MTHPTRALPKNCYLVVAILALGILSACAGKTQPVDLSFSANVSGEPFSCSGAYEVGQSSIKPKDLRLFVSNFQLHSEDGSSQVVELTDDGINQTKTLALLDFEDGKGNCKNGNERLFTKVVGQVKEGSYKSLSFDLGVPFADNHSDPVKADGPLTTSSMHWGWRGGYKFLRMEASTHQQILLPPNPDSLEPMAPKVVKGAMKIHLGSTGCEGSIGDISGCGRPNRARVELAVDGTTGLAVAMDIAPLLSAAVSAEPDCMSTAEEAGCAPVFAALGMDLKSGAVTGPGNVFGP